MTNLYVKNFLVTAMLILISFLLLGGAFLSFTYRYLASDKEKQLESVAGSVSSYSRTYLYGNSMQLDMDFNIVVSTVASVADADILVSNSKGRIVVSSEGPLSKEIGKAVGEGPMNAVISAGRYSGLGDLGGIYPRTSFIMGLPILSESGVIVGAVFVSSPASGLTDLFAAYLRLFIMSAILVLLTANILAFFAAKHMARPLKVMSRAAHEFAHGQFGARVPVSSRTDEIGELTVAFNAMADALQKAEQLRQDFVANVSHELKTPMTTIAGFIDGILDGTIEPSRQDEYLKIIRDEVHRLSRLVMRMLDIARLQSGAMKLNMQRVDICEVACRTLLSFEGKTEAKNLDVNVDMDEKGLFVSADADAIAQVIYNLIENAIKFSEPGSVVEVKAVKKGGKALLSVQNSGAGIPKEDLPYVFDRFYKTDKSRGMDREGMGLGLYIVKVILNGHGEDVWAESDEAGTRFIFTLSLAE